MDDALAIHFLHAAGAPLRGLTVCQGNAPLPRVAAVAEELGRRFDIPVHRGAAHPGDVRSAAVDALVAHRGAVLALAPLTNVAAALARGARWERLVVLGGTHARLPNVWPLRMQEFNLAVDLRAGAAVLGSATHVVTMDVCRRLLFTAADLDALPAWLAQGCRSWLRFALLKRARRAFPPWDVVAAIALVEPALLTWRARRVTVACAGIDARLRPGRLCELPGAGATLVATDLDAGGARTLYRSTVAGAPR